jgi:hypothetical protein
MNANYKAMWRGYNNAAINKQVAQPCYIGNVVVR